MTSRALVNPNINQIDDTEIIYEAHETGGNDNNYYNNNNDGIDIVYGESYQNDNNNMSMDLDQFDEGYKIEENKIKQLIQNNVL